MQQEWMMRRNCALTPRQFVMAYALLCGLSLLAALPFAVVGGAWVVLVYAVVEMAVAAAVFLHHARHATDREHIALTDSGLLIKSIDGGTARQVLLEPCWVKVTPPANARALVAVEARGVKVCIGRHVSEAARRRVALELRRELQGRSLVAR